MRFGVVLPQNEGMRDPIAARDFAQSVEGLGFDHLVGFDHVVGADPEDRPEGWRTQYSHKTFVHEPLVLFAHLGAVTKTLEFFSAIIILPQRQTVLFAKQAAEVDYLLGGRLRLGLGIGWNTLEFESLNEDFHNRGRRVVEQVEVLRALWTQEVVNFKGRWHTIDRAGVNPMPVQRPIPLWMGGYDENVLRRTARLADGWIPLFKPGEPTSKEMTARLKGYVKDAGRESAFGIEGRINLSDGSTGVGGTNTRGVDDWAKEFEDWKALGATHVSVATGGSPNRNEHIALLERFKALMK
jgi:probable F420-dependent oxidoreductase